MNACAWAEVIIANQPNGPTEVARLVFDSPTMTFRNQGYMTEPRDRGAVVRWKAVRRN